MAVLQNDLTQLPQQANSSIGSEAGWPGSQQKTENEMPDNQDKSENQKAPPAPPQTRVEVVFPEQASEKHSVPISTTLPSALKPAERPSQPATPSNESTNQPPPPPPPANESE